jgi:hypothetical protein
MKRQIIILSLLICNLFLIAQAGKESLAEIKLLKEKGVIYILLEDENKDKHGQKKASNDQLKKSIEENWSFCNYEFIDITEFSNFDEKTDDFFLYVTFDNLRYNPPYEYRNGFYYFLVISKGKRKNYFVLTQYYTALIFIDKNVGWSRENVNELINFKLKIINQYLSDCIAYNTVDIDSIISGNRNLLKEQTLVINKYSIKKPHKKNIPKIKENYKYNLLIVDDKRFKELIINSNGEYSFLYYIIDYSIGTYRYIIDKDGKMLYRKSSHLSGKFDSKDVIEIQENINKHGY